MPKPLLNIVLLHTKVLFFTLLFYILFLPVLLFLLIPIYLYRFLISHVKKWVRPDLAELVHPRSAVLSCDNYTKDPRWNLVVWITMEGIINLEELRSYFELDFVKDKLSNGKLKYPEYQQHYETWGGFQFWRWEDNFDIKEHIKLYESDNEQGVIDDKALLKIIKGLTWLSWTRGKSPWEILLIKNYQMTNDPTPSIPKSIFIFRLHHGLGDGYYILKLFLQDIGGLDLKGRLGIPKYPKRAWTLLRTFLVWVLGPYENIKMGVKSFDVNPWHIKSNPQEMPFNAALTGQIKLDLIKEIKNAYKVTFSSVLNSAIAGGIRKMMNKKGVKVPDNVHTAVAVPIPGHPETLRNHFIFAFVALPTGISDPVRRLRKSDQNIDVLKRSSAPLFNFLLLPLVGKTFPWLINLAFKNRHSTCLLSNFPGSPVSAPILGVPGIDMMFAAGVGPGNVGLGFTLISHTDHIRMLSVANPHILATDEEVEELNDFILEEILLLQALAPPPSTSTTNEDSV